MSNAYIYGQTRDNNKNQKKLKRFKVAMKLLIVIALISAGYIGVDLWKGKKREQPVVSRTQKIEQVASSQVFNTEFFQFSADKDWVFEEKLSTKTKFIYRKYRNSLIEHELNIYVNDKQTVFEATHVMPVGVDGESKLLSGPPSDHCKSTYPPKGGNRNPSNVKFANTSLLCNPDDIRYRLVLGLVNSGNLINLKRANGEVATYMITYQDLTFNNNGMDLSKIVNSFEAK